MHLPTLQNHLLTQLFYTCRCGTNILYKHLTILLSLKHRVPFGEHCSINESERIKRFIKACHYEESRVIILMHQNKNGKAVQWLHLAKCSYLDLIPTSKFASHQFAHFPSQWYATRLFIAKHTCAASDNVISNSGRITEVKHKVQLRGACVYSDLYSQAPNSTTLIMLIKVIAAIWI